ncbi:MULTISPECIES: IS5 family transposase [unclassified Streptomyces]|uniref:IS5 family transposase n=1 Tax=unclassified Streptomyces TaxID=2593676 RepID=UPI0022703AF1|nr:MULTISPECIES: IS5 family transposase [unclassified Streptomyces]MCY0924516.1 IS5 family transposase [Streptomyces sp. H27-G5]MCY0963505.1 IS5 family transposase [Streptomyces sp. H27-H5]
MTSSQPRLPYLSDLSDARWALMEPTLTAWRAERQKTSLNLGGKVTDLREVMNAILFLNRTGVPWRYLPHDFPPHTTVFGYFSAWTADGTIEKLGVHLHRMVREQAGRTAEPTACVIDAQSVKTAISVPTDTQGTDAGKKIVGRKRSIVVDTLGLLLLVIVTAASVSDNEAGKQLLTQLAADHPTITKAWVDTGYKTKAIEHGATLGIDVDVVPRNEQVKGFSVIPRRWVVERSFGWIMMHRRLARDYETKPAHSESMIRIAMISNLA